MCDPNQIITDVEVPQWMEKILKARSELWNVSIAEYMLEVMAAHLENRPFDLKRIQKEGDNDRK